MAHRTHEREGELAACLGPFDEVGAQADGGGHAAAVGRQHGLDLLVEERLGAHLCGEKTRLDRRFHLKALAQPLHKVQVRARQRAAQVLDAGCLRHAAGQHEVDAVGHVAHAPLHIVEDLGNLMRQLARQAEHRETPGPGDGLHHVDGM